jgi:hypothetical protein
MVCHELFYCMSITYKVYSHVHLGRLKALPPSDQINMGRSCKTHKSHIQGLANAAATEGNTS